MGWLDWLFGKKRHTTRVNARVAHQQAESGTDDVMAWADAAQQATDGRDYARALELWTAVIAARPDLDVAYARRAQAYEALDRKPDALNDYTRAVELGQDPAFLSQVLLLRGCLLSVMDQWVGAEADLRRSTEISPMETFALCAHGLALIQLGRREAAIEAYSRALTINPALEKALQMRGHCYFMLQRLDEALQDYSTLVNVRPDRADALGLRGNAYYAMGEWENAIGDFTRAMAMDGGLDHHVRRGHSLRQLGRLREALVDYEVALAKNPANLEALRHQAEVLETLGESQRAEAVLNQLDGFALRAVQDIERNGKRVMAALVMANAVLYSAESSEDSYCRVLMTFDPECDEQRLCELAHWLYSFKNTSQSDPELQFLAELTTAETANPKLRRRVPPRFTGGAVVYVADLWVYRRFLPQGVLHGPLLACVAEPGDQGQQALLPPELILCE